MDQDKTESTGELTKILYVEDEESIRGVVKEFFQTIGYDVTSAEEGNEALKYFNQNKDDSLASKFALVITDINMPNGMGGIELIKEIHKSDQKIPIIAISGYLKNSDYIKDLPSDVSYFQKPVRLKELAQKIKEIL